MGEFHGQSVLVAGGGVLGLTLALSLARAGARVAVCDPADPLGSASGVAAGLLAPVFESGLDPLPGAALPLLRDARDRWPALIEAVEAPAGALDRSGTLLAAADGERLAGLERRLRAMGGAIEMVEGAAMRRLRPELAPELATGIYTPEDWRLAPALVLAALRRALVRAEAVFEPSPLQAGADGPMLAGRPVHADHLVIAAGAEAAGLASLAPELAALSPIKGQILHFSGGPVAGPSLRDFEGYVAPQPGGAVAGATMEAGRRDREVEVEVMARLRARATRLIPALAAAPAEGRAGVRAASPDGLPLVGASGGGDRRRSTGPSIWLAVGARRNGWLLAPLVAELLVARMAGGSGAPWAAAMDPGRFGPV